MPNQTELEIQELREEIHRLREERAPDRERRNSDKEKDSAPAPEKPQEGKKEGDSGKQPDSDKPPKPPLAQRIVLTVQAHPIATIVLLIALVATAIGGVILWEYLQSYESTDDARVDGHVNSITPRISGTVVGVHVAENQIVKKGDLLIELDPGDYNVALQRAHANVQQARASTVAQQTSVPITSTSTQTTIETARSEILNAQAGLAAAQREQEIEAARLSQTQANNAKAQADLARYKLLVAKDEVSREEYDQRVADAAAAAAAVRAQQAALSAAQKAIDQRSAALEQARSQLNQAVSNAPQQVIAQRATVEVQRAALGAAQAALNEANLNLQYTKIYAPVDGVIGRRAAELGQRVQQGQQLLSIVQLDDIWVTANFKENQLRKMRAGQSATIHVDAFDRDYDGYVESMPAASSATFSMLPAENATGNFVKVVQRLPVRLRFKPNQDSEKQLRPGMSVVPKVWLR